MDREPDLLEREPVHAARRGDRIEPERSAEPGERGDGALAVESHPAAEEVARVEEPERHERVGERGLGAAAAVARRSRVGAGAPRADAQEAAHVAPAEAPAARADRRDGHRRERRREALHLRPQPSFRAAAVDDGDVEARAAHVARDHLREAERGGQRLGGSHAGDRTRLREQDRADAGRAGRHRAATRLHQRDGNAQPGASEAGLERVEERCTRPRRVRVQHRGRHALVLTHDRDEIRRARDDDIRVALADDRRHTPLVRRVAARPQQADREALDAFRADQPIGGREDASLVERDEHGTVAVDPLADLGDPPARDERRQRPAHAVDAEPMAARHRPEVGEAFGRDEAGRRAGELGEAIRHHRGAESEMHGIAEHARARNAHRRGSVCEGGEQPIERRARRGRRLASPAVDSVGHEAVGEGAADVNADGVGGHPPRDNTQHLSELARSRRH